ncbi:TPA: hypothetical protein DCR49_07670 [Candidatus Delongbacteria bacterium]|nr:MAG: hypothetical protein A2Y39_00030 [Candidatus Delongbacteria bacterium GWF2_40_14]HAQ61858.1 hypothetical protein [Candidatus Delongbacteria bacterium]
MKNLIMADFKVLGNKIWQVPLSVLLLFFLILSGFSIYTGKTIIMVPFIVIPIVTMLLGYELMHLSDGSRIHYQVASLPSGKAVIVFEKYLMILVLFSIGIIAEFLLNIFINLSGASEGYETVLASANVSLLAILRIAIFVIPLFFLTKKSRKAFMLFIIWGLGMYVIHGNATLELLYARYDLNKTIGIYAILIVSCIVVMCGLKIIYKNKADLMNLLLIPVAAIFPISLALLQESLNDLIFTSVTIHAFPEAFENEYHRWVSGADRNFFLIHLFVSSVLLSISLYLWKKDNMKQLIKKLSLILLLPVIFYAMENSLRIFLLLFEIIRTNNDWKNFIIPIFSVSQYIIFIPMLIFSIYYSKKFLTEGE